MRPILREHTDDGRVIGDPLPLVLGVGVIVEVVDVVERALFDFLLPGEQVLAIAKMRDPSWEMYYVLTSHHFCRVALAPERDEAHVLTCAYEHAASGRISVRLRSGERIELGSLTHARDGHLINSASWNVRFPEGSDGAHIFVEGDAVRSGRVDLTR